MSVFDYAVITTTVIFILIGMLSAAVTFACEVEKPHKNDGDVSFLVLCVGIVLGGIFSLVFYSLWPAVFLLAVAVYWTILGSSDRKAGVINLTNTRYIQLGIGFLYFVIWVLWLKFH